MVGLKLELTGVTPEMVAKLDELANKTHNDILIMGDCDRKHRHPGFKVLITIKTFRELGPISKALRGDPATSSVVDFTPDEVILDIVDVLEILPWMGMRTVAQREDFEGEPVAPKKPVAPRHGAKVYASYESTGLSVEEFAEQMTEILVKEHDMATDDAAMFLWEHWYRLTIAEVNQDRTISLEEPRVISKKDCVDDSAFLHAFWTILERENPGGIKPERLILIQEVL